jgi:serine/threonine protein phosphatase PrpC
MNPELKGSLIPKNEGSAIKILEETEGIVIPNLKGKLVDTGDTLKILEVTEIKKETSSIELGNYGTKLYSLEHDCCTIFNSNNNRPCGQDAFSVSPDLNTFSVCDGVGGAGEFNPPAVTRWSRMIAEYTSSVGLQYFIENQQSIVNRLKGVMTDEGYTIIPSVKGLYGIKTTLSMAQRTSGNTYEILCIGDSPIYIIEKKTGKIIQQYGEDALTNTTDTPLSNSVGLDSRGEYIAPKNPDHIVTKPITLRDDQLLVIATDYFSDFTARGGNLLDYLSLSAEAFHQKVTGPGRAKADDATICFIQNR